MDKTCLTPTAEALLSESPSRSTRQDLTIPFNRLLLLALFLLGPALAAHATLFTNDTVLGPLDTSCDGQSIVVSNCVLTVDGPHTFAGLRLAGTAVLTHSATPNGWLPITSSVSDEPQTLLGTSPVTLLNSNVLTSSVLVKDLSGTLVYSNNLDYLLSSVDVFTALQRTATSSIPDGATVLVSYQYSIGTTNSGLNLLVTGDLEIEPGAAINANGRGYSLTYGFGHGGWLSAPTSGGGGGHGGYGGNSSSNALGGMAYDALLAPTDKGSPGGSGITGPGGPGGGAILLNVGGTLTINGAISADGTNGAASRCGGGAGGSIWLTAQTLDGTGTISADGGAGEPIHGGGGGGGRIALDFATNSFSGTVQARGGSGFVGGGAGTIYRQSADLSLKQVLVDNGGRSGTNTPVELANAADLTISGAALVTPSTSLALGNLLVASGSQLAAMGPPQNIVLIARNAIVQAGARISLDGAGYPVRSGTGFGGSYVYNGIICAGGGGHGGYGGSGGPDIPGGPGSAGGGNCYDSATAPTLWGSGGGYIVSTNAGAGGGALRLMVSGTLQVDGVLSADGMAGLPTGGGGGAGGSLWLTVGALGGTGSISANGGNGLTSASGGGGGGRIALEFDTNLFAGAITASGGSGIASGGAGTIYLKPSGGVGTMLADNSGRAGSNTPISLSTTCGLQVSGAAKVQLAGSQTLAGLVVGSNSTLFVAAYVSLSTITVAGDAAIEKGGAIRADGLGYPAGAGTGYGAGRTYSSGGIIYGGGGAHAGFGGTASNPLAYGGYPSPGDNTAAPTQAGSGGGGYDISNYSGGAGGGVIRITIGGALTLDGEITANATPGAWPAGGGGAGGSVWLTVAQFSGSGLVAANGGSGYLPDGGGGGGGCIAIQYTAPATNTFTGALTAYGGNGANPGGAGTVYLAPYTYSQPSQLLVDNGGLIGTNTLVSTTSLAALDIRGGASVVLSSYYKSSSIIVRSNATLLPAYTSYPNVYSLTVSSNLTIETGGRVFADGMGYGPGQGYGLGGYYHSGYAYYGGGGGYGGAGGAGAHTNAFGGRTYGPALPYSVSPGSGGGGYGLGGYYHSGYAYYGGGGGYGGAGGAGAYANAPGGKSYGSALPYSVSPGSGGGGYASPTYMGGAGGGAISLRVDGTLLVNGTLSVRGAPAAGNGGGGGSGGGLELDLRTLAGSGLISADGGDGSLPYGGGGGGGRIYVTCFSNLFTGTISARGGAGANNGGAGTIYTLSRPQNASQLLFDNGGLLGANTPLSDSGPFTLTIAGGAVGASSSSLTVGSLNVASNGWLSLTTEPLTVTGDATIALGGGVTADGTGYTGGNGPGAGFSSSTAAKGGGGHGGCGGANPDPPLGSAYDSVQAPTERGSGGGNGSGGTSVPPFGGTGGGALRLTVSRTLTVNGRISANGLPGDINSGGGAGGSVWLSASTLAGTGSILANGGDGNGSAGGGGGGRIALNYFADSFTGTLTASGGNGSVPGGAGTIYIKPNSTSVGQLFIDNGGLAGANTPLGSGYGLPSSPFDLNIGGAAMVNVGTAPLLSNLVIHSGAQLTSLSPQANTVELAVLRDLTVGTDAAISLDAKGYLQASGPGAGTSTLGQGSGGGYGGNGGASTSGAPGGPAYGSVTQPTDPGSGGGAGYCATDYDGSRGGGSIRLTVGGTFTLDGRLSANGNDGLQDDSGGGAGGSLWVTAHTLTGGGTISADGGGGELFNGGGGGGGRIALYSSANTYTGLVSVLGGWGASSGTDGTLYTSATPASLAVIAQTPSGLVSNGVSSVDLLFNSPVDPFTISASDFLLQTPLGPLPESGLAVSALNPTTLRISFPLQTCVGDYSLQAGPQIQDLFGQPMAQSYSGAFTIVLPTIQGTITDTNGLPVPGVFLQPSGGLSPAITDANGAYTLGVLSGWIGTIRPILNNTMFIPSVRSFTNVTETLTAQDFLMAPTPTLNASLSGTNLWLRWPGLSGVTYQPLCSTNLLDWLPWGDPMPGSNGTMELLVPIGTDGKMFFRFQATD